VPPADCLRVPKVTTKAGSIGDTHPQRENSKGVRAGQVIRLAARGPGMGGSPAGDLLLEVQFKPHPLPADGRNLHLTLR